MKKRGGNPRPKWQITAFRNVVNECELKDLGIRGQKFTWSNRRNAVHYVHERLDRAFANLQWWSRFPFASVVHGLVAYSDHIPLWVKTNGEEVPVKLKKLFKFESMWVGEKAYEDIITSTWRRDGVGCSMAKVMGLIKESGD
ncbi:uncharacterized protein LOC121267268 [Juglans microcarpa x Juglans regia]|uniref:uncharacterized protein LOC121267268 n=1 Tax=Juglans microcarpa x Juglans regia TaxID=2249226 RepID=UPI001B7E1C7C|nr:uncharacterized protein LOC121267268 [Juglans microcarpa x Juglans regia]